MDPKKYDIKNPVFTITILLLFCCIVPGKLKGMSQVDSLHYKLEQSTDNRERLSLQIQLAEQYFQSNPEKAYHYISEAEKLIPHSDADDLKCLYYTRRWELEYVYKQKTYDSLINYTEAAVDYCGLSENHSLHIENQFRLFSHYYLKYDFETAYKHAVKMISLSHELNDSTKIAQAYVVLGTLNYKIENYEEALVHLKSALNYANPKIKVEALHEIAKVYHIQQRNEKTISTCLQILN